jgi:hypothetical protein
MQECMICLEENREFVKMSCNHTICKSCYPIVLRRYTRCPMCEAVLIAVEELEDPSVSSCLCAFMTMAGIGAVLVLAQQLMRHR